MIKMETIIKKVVLVILIGALIGCDKDIDCDCIITNIETSDSGLVNTNCGVIDNFHIDQVIEIGSCVIATK